MTFCARCGYNSVKDEPVERDGFVIDPLNGVSYRGKPLHMTPAHAIIMHSLATEKGAVRIEALLGRIGCEESAPNVLTAHVCNARKALVAAKVPNAIKSERGFGYVWACSA